MSLDLLSRGHGAGLSYSRIDVLPAFPHPEHIRFEVDQCRICFAEQKIKWQLTIDRQKFKIVIVICKAKAVFAAHFTGVIKGFRPTLLVIEALTVVGIEPGKWSGSRCREQSPSR